MIDPEQLRGHVIRPVLKDLGLWSPEAEDLLLGTACQESHCGRYLHQIQGPAIGIYQMEPATFGDIYQNYLRFKQPLAEKIQRWVFGDPEPGQMAGNLYFATAMCRIHYLRVPAAIPRTIESQASYWKLYYNTWLGRGTTQEYKLNWLRFARS